ncbi:hypothetical protein BCR42DRAFT_421899 [Absidia repens]|uniref:Uncharacterized protein n=1 Tax=Absidia repens TaxID=90262 RepID=A0A1X2I6Y9_9FUNG|nr:hypothetical protein BCR42DRAFT_421899 [Absidia repens]
MNTSSSPTLYQHYQNDTVDPYRRHKSQPSDSNSSEQEILHSRTASDSSTSRLAVNAVSYSHGLSTREYDDDPYAMSRALHHTTYTSHSNSNNSINHNSDNNSYSVGNKRFIPMANDSCQRANSYLPYSHHQRDPAQHITPIYVEDDQQQTCQGVGSMLQDSFSMDSTQNEINRPKASQTSEEHDMEVIEKREPKEKRRYCRLKRRIWICLVTGFLVLLTLLLYFLIPRMPTVKFSSADPKRQHWSEDAQSLTAQWIVDFSLDNSGNWIPTWMQKMVVALDDKDTKTQIGWGVLEPQWIPPRNSSYIVRIPINISYSSTTLPDETISDLISTCGPRRQGQSVDPIAYQPELFNATFRVDIYLQGLPKSSHTVIVPDDGIQCPT